MRMSTDLRAAVAFVRRDAGYGVRTLNHMVVGGGQPVRRDDEARAVAALPACALDARGYRSAALCSKSDTPL